MQHRVLPRCYQWCNALVMARRKRPKTFFEIVEAKGQAGTARILGNGFYPVRIHRAYKALVSVDDKLIDRCVEVFGADFDRAGTLVEWHKRRLGRAASATP